MSPSRMSCLPPVVLWCERLFASFGTIEAPLPSRGKSAAYHRRAAVAHNRGAACRGGLLLRLAATWERVRSVRMRDSAMPGGGLDVLGRRCDTVAASNPFADAVEVVSQAGVAE